MNTVLKILYARIEQFSVADTPYAKCAVEEVRRVIGLNSSNEEDVLTRKEA